LVVVAFGLAWLLWRQPAATFPLRLDPELSGEVIRAQRQDASRVQPDEVALVARLDQALRARSRAELALLQADLLARWGARRYRQAVSLLVGRTVAALRYGLALAHHQGGLQPWLDSLPRQDAQRRAHEELYGSFLLGVALPSGLVDREGRADPDLEAHARVLLIHRLLGEAARLAQVEEVSLTLPERRVLLRWRVERALGSPRQTRLRALEELRSLEPAYPADAAKGRIGPENGRLSGTRP
jgi:hypothetical protein